MNYDPNLTNSGRMAMQTVRLTFGVWEHRKEMEVQVGGNCTGLTVIDSAVESAYNELERLGIFGCNDTYAVLYLEHPESGDTLECADDEDKCEDWLKDMLIKAEIVSIEPHNL